MKQEHDVVKQLLEDRKRADELIASLSGDVPRLTDAIALLNQRLTEHRLVGTPFEAAASVRTTIIPGIPGARLAITSIFLSNGGVAVNFNFQQGSGNNFGPLSGRAGGAGNIFLGATVGFLSLQGAVESPVMIADVANDFAINNASAQAIAGHVIFTTLGP